MTSTSTTTATGGEQPITTGVDFSQFGFSTALNQQSVGVSLSAAH